MDILHWILFIGFLVGVAACAIVIMLSDSIYPKGKAPDRELWD